MRTRIFLSAVSGQFKDCRDALASDLRAIGCEVRAQEDFQQGPRTLIEHLEEYIAQCDRVIALIGDLVIDEQSFGAHHPRVATELNNLALLLRDTNRLGGGRTVDAAGAHHLHS